MHIDSHVSHGRLATDLHSLISVSSPVITTAVHILTPITDIPAYVPPQACLASVLMGGALRTLVIHGAGGGGGEVALGFWAGEGGDAGVQQVLVDSNLHVPAIPSYRH